MNLVNGSIQSELSRFFQVIEDSPVVLKRLSAAALTQARKKFYASAFTALNRCLTDEVYHGAFVQRWNGFQLLAVDGSTVGLPNTLALEDHFGRTSSHARHPSARVSQLYDVMNKLSIDVQIAPIATGERRLARQHLEHAPDNSLILYDRGYPAFWLFALHFKKGIHFCMRMPVGFSVETRLFLASKAKEAMVELTCSRYSAKRCEALCISSSALKVRFIRIELDNGEVEVLVTSLFDQKKYPRTAFLNLYHQRWFVEEDYKIMKSRLEVENFSGLSVHAIEQDIHAKVLTKNIAAVAVLEAEVLAKEKYRHRKLRYKINFTYTLSQLKDNIVRFVFLNATILLDQFIQNMAGVVNAVRPERKYERQTDKINRRRHHMAYKRVG